MREIPGDDKVSVLDGKEDGSRQGSTRTNEIDTFFRKWGETGVSASDQAAFNRITSCLYSAEADRHTACGRADHMKH